MARMKFPGTNKSRSSPENKKKLNMLGRRGKERTAGKRQGSAITPVLISLRRYREIFGDSDEEVHSLSCTFSLSFVYHVCFTHSAIAQVSFSCFDFFFL